MNGTILSQRSFLNSSDDFTDVLTGTGHEIELLRGSSVIVETDLGKIAVYGLPHDHMIGDILKMEIYIEKPSPQRNPGGFDEKAYWAKKGIHLKGYVHSAKSVGFNIKMLFMRKIFFFRNQLLNNIKRSMPPKQAGILSAALLGEKSAVEDEVYDSFKKTGIVHVTVVSGAAVSFFISPVKKILSKVKSKRSIKSALLILILLLYGSLTLWGPSITRAITMMVIYIFGKLICRRINFVHSVSLGICVILWFSPFLALDIGFWMSIFAVAGIFFLTEKFERKMAGHFFARNISISIAVNLCISPILIYMTGEIQVLSVIANLFVLPLLKILIPYGCGICLLGFLPLSVSLFQIIALPLRGIIDFMVIVGETLSAVSFITLRIYGHTCYVILGILFLILMFFSKSKRIKKSMAMLSVISVVTWSVSGYFESLFRSDLELIFIDVGQGDSTLVITGDGKSILIDGGIKGKGKGAVSDVLDHFGIYVPDMYIVTHGHSDHCGGIIDLILSRGGKTLLLPSGSVSGCSVSTGQKQEYGDEDITDELLSAAKEKDIKILEVGRGDMLKLDEKLDITFYNPDKEGEYDEDPNKNSLVIKLTYFGLNVMIMGDATGDIEKDIVEEGEDIAAQLYRIAHHGSPYSTNNDIIDRVDPLISIISVGYNVYGHPDKDVIDRLHYHGSVVYRTDMNGAVIAEYDDGKLKIDCMIP